MNETQPYQKRIIPVFPNRDLYLLRHVIFAASLLQKSDAERLADVTADRNDIDPHSSQRNNR